HRRNKSTIRQTHSKSAHVGPETRVLLGTTIALANNFSCEHPVLLTRHELRPGPFPPEDSRPRHALPWRSARTPAELSLRSAAGQVGACSNIFATNHFSHVIDTLLCAPWDSTLLKETEGRLVLQLTASEGIAKLLQRCGVSFARFTGDEPLFPSGNNCGFAKRMLFGESPCWRHNSQHKHEPRHQPEYCFSPS